MKKITILGSTGTIGVNTLDVLSRMRDDISVHALTGNHNVDLMFEQCQALQPALAVMAGDSQAAQLRVRLAGAGIATEVLSGPQALVEAASAPEVDYVMAGIVGAAGLLPNLAAARAGKRVMLANKESLVMSGELFMRAVHESGAELLPIDSEHNAIFQCLPAGASEGSRGTSGVRRILLTASGGPFRSWPVEKLADVTPAQACAHPNWVMGRKISVDSASMMNKGLEIIEACWLFGLPLESIDVVIHPQSVIHSMVEYLDGSVLAQLGNPDMRTPIAYSLAWPNRCESGVEPLDFFAIQHLTFEKPDEQRFRCLRLARDAFAAGGTASAILNAANEIAVAAFLDGNIRFVDIPRLIEDALDRLPAEAADDIETVLSADQRAREHVSRLIAAAA